MGTEQRWRDGGHTDINSLKLSDAYMRNQLPSSVQLMVCRLIATKALSEPMMVDLPLRNKLR